jgi:short subunit dehydrogenase-like uncharacterized protein
MQMARLVRNGTAARMRQALRSEKEVCERQLLNETGSSKMREDEAGERNRAVPRNITTACNGARASRLIDFIQHRRPRPLMRDVRWPKCKCQMRTKLWNG